MTESSGAFLHYRSPYVWHSRAVNFNRQLIKKLNQVQKCNSKQVVVAARKGANKKKNLGKIDCNHHRENAAATSSSFNDHFRHRLLEPLSTEDTSSASSSLASSLSSCDHPNAEKEVTAVTAASAATTTATTTFSPSLYPKYQSHAGNKMVARNYLEHYNNHNHNNTSRANTTGYQYGQYHSNTAFSPPGGRCPVHGTSTGLHHQHHSQYAYKQPLNYDSGTQPQHRYSSTADLQEYPTHLPHHHHPHAYLSTLPYGYHMAYGQSDKQHHLQYLGHHYPHQHYYTSSQMYHPFPSSYHHHPHNSYHQQPHLLSPLGRYLSPSTLYTSKPHHLTYSSHQQQQQHQQTRRSSSRPFEFTNTAISHNNIRMSGLPSMDHLHNQQQQQQQSSPSSSSPSRCKGHLIVLATILSVIIIGTLLGFALAIIS